MQKVISTERVPIKMWLDDIDENALVQVKNVANLPFVHKWVSVMPDAHMGFGMPIGGVVALKGVIIPYAVGSDIGCGMCAVKTSLTEISIETLKKIMGEIRKVIPVGFKRHNEPQGIENMPKYGSVDSLEIISKEWLNAEKSLGTLGGGNHFIEIQKGSDGHIWIMIHSGSRNLGFQVARHYNNLAIKLNKKWFSEVPEKHELAFLPTDGEEGKAYIREMQYCVDYALANRELMMERVAEIIINFVGGETGPIINIAHNYASLEHHFGKDVWLHRKGATLAREGTIGIIPGSQGTKSYIVKGKGNPDSFNSCSHGAGRVMGRKQAIRELDLEKEQKMLDDQGILHSVRGKNDLEEAPSVYKDISVVMKNQEDLVSIEVELRPLAVVKG